MRGTREGTLRGLTLTGSVITSSGLVLAATFATLGVLPLVFFAAVGLSVAFGVLLDALVVRSVLVPSVVLLLRRVVWWPTPLSGRRGSSGSRYRSGRPGIVAGAGDGPPSGSRGPYQRSRLPGDHPGHHQDGQAVDRV